MPVIYFKVDTSNENGVISKDHPIDIKKGTEIEFDPIPENIERLIKIGVLEIKSEDQEQDPPEDPPADDDQDQDPGDQDPSDELPDDIEELKKMADELGIDYAANIGAKTLQDRIQKHLEK